VVGAGAIGLSAGLALRDRGARVLVLEAERPGAGQSAGPGRIFRHVHDSPGLVRLAVAARAAWRAAEERFGRGLVDGRGALLVGERDAHAERLRAEGVEHALLGPAELPGPLEPLGPGLLDPGGGTIDAEGYVAALAGELAPAIRRARVLEARPEGDAAAAVTEDGAVSAGRVLVCAGAGTPALAARLGLELPVTSTEHRRVTFAGPAPPGFPCLLERSGAAGATAYGTPLPAGGFALGTGAADDRPDAEAIATTRDHLLRVLPGLDPTAAGVVRCPTTVLAGHPEALALWRRGPILVFAGGNLFKHAPALGPLLADAVLEDRVDPVLEPG
jgi:sarcosine oxidase